MRVTTDLRPMFSYSLIPIIICLLFLIGIITYFILTNKKKEAIKPVIPNKQDKTQIKNNYLIKIDTLANDLKEAKITSRQAYQRLSTLIRNFIYEMTSIRVQNCTLEDIKLVNIPILYELVSEYYDPEFSRISKGNITNSIAKTREVIIKWN